MIVRRVVHVDLHAGAQVPRVLLERRLEPARAQAAAGHPLRRERAHPRQQRGHIEPRRAEQFQRPRRAPPLGKRRALKQHGSGITTRHRQVRCVRARVHPAALADRPAVTGRVRRSPSLHPDHAIVDVEPQRRPEPLPQFAHGQSVAHRHRPRADEALPARAQRQPLDRPAGRVRAIEHPHGFARPGGGLQHVAQRSNKRVDAAAEVLQVHQQHVERIEHPRGRPAHLAVEAEDGDAVRRIHEVRRFDHVVLLVSPQTVLRAERARQRDIAGSGQRIERVTEFAGHGRRVREQCHPPPREFPAQRRIREQTVDAERHRRAARRGTSGGSSRAKAAG